MKAGGNHRVADPLACGGELVGTRGDLVRRCLLEVEVVKNGRAGWRPGGDDETVIELEVAEADLGKIIGRSGRVARALRNVLSAAGSKLNKRYALEIIE